MKSKRFFVVLIVGLIVSLNANAFDRVISFGDSLSDTGNIFTLRDGLYPAPLGYWEGRYSNGSVWVEYLSKAFHMEKTILAAHLIDEQPIPNGNLFINFAFGGGESGSDGLPNNPPGFLWQIGAFSETVRYISSNDLVTVWIGANDFLGNEDQLNTSEDVAALIKNSMTNIGMGLRGLIQLGAGHILVANMPDLGSTPKNNSTLEGRMTGRALTIAFNDALTQVLDAIESAYPYIFLYRLDIFSLFEDTLANPQKYGFSNTQVDALSEGLSFDGADGYLFWDAIHPTTSAHHSIANQAYGTITFDTGSTYAAFLESKGFGNPILGFTDETGSLKQVHFLASDSAEETLSSNQRPGDPIYGYFGIAAELTDNESVAAVTVFLPNAVPSDYHWYLSDSDGWENFTRNAVSGELLNGAVFNEARTSATIYITDNGPYDQNTAIGLVQSDPMGIGRELDDAGVAGENDTDSCFISSTGKNTLFHDIERIVKSLINP